MFFLAVVDKLPHCVLEVVVRSHTLRVLTVPVGFSVGLLLILHVWTLLVAEALYGTRLQVARVSFKPALVDEETCSIYCTLPDGTLPDGNIIAVGAKCIFPAGIHRQGVQRKQLMLDSESVHDFHHRTLQMATSCRPSHLL